MHRTMIATSTILLALATHAAALRMTTSQGGAFHMNSSRNAAIASAKSSALVMPTVHTG